jgi:hypothetical protein
VPISNGDIHRIVDATRFHFALGRADCAGVTSSLLLEALNELTTRLAIGLPTLALPLLEARS